jgi:hypothetical protein
MSNLYKQEIYCETESAWVNTWKDTDTPITVCPNNNTHTVISSSVHILETREINTVKVEEETTPVGSNPTGGHFGVTTVGINCLASQTSTADKSFDWPVSMLSIKFMTDQQHIGDVINMDIAPNTIIGVLTATASINDTTLTVNSTVLDNAFIGTVVRLINGTNSSEIGYAKKIDKTTSNIWLTQPLTQSFAIGSYYAMSIRMMNNYNIGVGGSYDFGSSKIGGSYVPTGIRGFAKYTNNSTFDKQFNFIVEYLY